MKYTVVLSLLILLTASCKHTPASIYYESGPIEEIFVRAKQEHKKVFVLISNSECGQCEGFKKKLNTQATTVGILAADYLCYYADVMDPGQKDIARIVKCPSYPFPYFFDEDGNLEAFGFPNSPDYNISNLSDIRVDEYKFRELFRLLITTPDYKQLVSLNLRAYLLMKQQPGKQLLIDSAYNLSLRSMNIAVYPYNTYLTHLLGQRTRYPSPTPLPLLVIPSLTHADQVVYGSLLDSIPYSLGDSLHTITTTDEIAYIFDTNSQECGTIAKGTDYNFHFAFRNTGTKELVIAKAEHSCSCIELQWPKQPIPPGGTGSISGVFHADEKGIFKKDIYIHTPSPKVPMRIISLTGVVQ